MVTVDPQQVISTARCNNLIDQQASVASGAVLPKTEPSPSFPHQRLCINQMKSPEASVADVVNGHGRGGLRLRPPLPSACRDVS